MKNRAGIVNRGSAEHSEHSSARAACMHMQVGSDIGTSDIGTQQQQAIVHFADSTHENIPPILDGTIGALTPAFSRLPRYPTAMGQHWHRL